MSRPSLQERIEQRVTRDEATGCWLWTGTINQNGYGRMKTGAVTTVAHRIVYEMHRGPVPPGLDLDHLCRVRRCVNPDHLEAVTRSENARRGLTGTNMSSKTHCPHGHEYAGENVTVDANGSRQCRICQRERTRAYRIRKALA